MTLTTSVLQGGANSHATTSEEMNFGATDFVAEGVVGAITNTSGVAPMTGGFAVGAQGSPNMTVAVSTGVGYVTATPTSGNSQTLRVNNSASSNVTISANATGGTRYDWLYIKIDPDKAKDPNSGASDVATLVTSRSTSSSSDNGTPPTYGTLLAVVTVANGASSITNGNIADKRTSTGATPGDATILPYHFFGQSAQGAAQATSWALSSWSPTLVGFSADPSGGLYYYSQIGKLVTLFIRQPNAGTSNATGFTLTLPVTAKTISGMIWSNAARVQDNGTIGTAAGLLTVDSGGTVLNVFKDYNASAFTNSGNKRLVYGTIQYEAA